MLKIDIMIIKHSDESVWFFWSKQIVFNLTIQK